MAPSWKTAYRSFYYATAAEPDDIVLDPQSTAILVIDVQNTYVAPKDDPDENARWQPFFDRMRRTVIPNTQKLIADARARGVEVIYARIACLKEDGRDRSLSQKKPGFNYLLLPKEREDAQVVPELAPWPDDIVVTKTTDSCLTGTNLRLVLANMAIRTVVCAGIFTDQCVSSTVRSLADESFDVVVVDDCCAAATMALHAQELETINMIYCHVVQLEDVLGFYGGAAAEADEQSAAEPLAAAASLAWGPLEFPSARKAAVKAAFEEACAGMARLELRAAHALVFSPEERKEFDFDSFDTDLQATCEGCKQDMSWADVERFLEENL